MTKSLEHIWLLSKIIGFWVVVTLCSAAFITAIDKALSPSEIEPECEVTLDDQFGFEHEIKGVVRIDKRQI